MSDDAIKAALESFRHLAREMQRTRLTIVVTEGHTGPMLSVQHPTDGCFVECSYQQAQALDREAPLRLERIIARDTAHFVVAGPFGTFERLCPPPYDISAIEEAARDA